MSKWARTTWILGTKEAGGLCTLCSSAMSVHSIGSSSEEASLPREDRARFRGGSCTHEKVTSVSENEMGTQPRTVPPALLLREQKMLLVFVNCYMTDFRLPTYVTL